MAEIKCLYCKSVNTKGEANCATCGLPLSMSLPEPAVHSAPAAGIDTNSVLKEAASRFSAARAEFAREVSEKKSSSMVPVFITLAVTVAIAIVAIIWQSSAAVEERSREYGTRIELDQSVGAPATGNLEAAQKAFNEGRLEEAERLIKTIPANDPSYERARKLLRDIETQRPRK